MYDYILIVLRWVKTKLLAFKKKTHATFRFYLHCLCTFIKQRLLLAYIDNTQLCNDFTTITVTLLLAADGGVEGGNRDVLLLLLLFSNFKKKSAKKESNQIKNKKFFVPFFSSHLESVSFAVAACEILVKSVHPSSQHATFLLTATFVFNITQSRTSPKGKRHPKLSIRTLHASPPTCHDYFNETGSEYSVLVCDHMLWVQFPRSAVWTTWRSSPWCQSGKETGKFSLSLLVWASRFAIFYLLNRTTFGFGSDIVSPIQLEGRQRDHLSVGCVAVSNIEPVFWSVSPVIYFYVSGLQAYL